MPERLNKNQLQMMLAEIESLEKEHPKAEVVYSVDQRMILILYPLPKNFQEIRPCNCEGSDACQDCHVPRL